MKYLTFTGHQLMIMEIPKHKNISTEAQFSGTLTRAILGWPLLYPRSGYVCDLLVFTRCNLHILV